MNILSLLKRFVPPYKWQVAANLFFNVLSTILSLFSFATIIPVLQILFGLSEGTATYMSLDSAASFNDTLDILKNNLYYFLQMQIETRGAQSVLLLLGACSYGLQVPHSMACQLFYGAYTHGRIARPACAII